MKKLILDIPEWAQDRNIYIFAGIEVLGNFCRAEDRLLFKTERCTICGKCCIDFPLHLGGKPADEYWTPEIREELKKHFKVDTLLVCKYLDKEIWNFNEYDNQEVYPCNAPATIIPWSCMTGFTCGFDEWKKQQPFCPIEYEEIDSSG